LYERPTEHASGAYTSVSGAELRKVNPLNFLEALRIFDPSFIVNRPNASGDDPNVSSSVNIRGAYNFPASATIPKSAGITNTNVQLNPSAGDFIADNIGNPNQPVVLLDGVQVALQTALDIDINRIDKIVILKDAAATAQYGVRGGTGVLLIQTRKPQAGNLQVTYSGQVQVATPELSSFDLLDATEKFQIENAAGLYTNNSALYNKRLYQLNKGINTDWLSIPTQTGVGTKHYLALEGGDDDIRYGLDFSYNNIQGVMKGSSRQNTNIGGYVNARVKTLNISNYISYTRSQGTNSPYGSFADYARLNPYWNPYDSVSGKFAKVLEEYTYQGNNVRTYNPAYNSTLSTTDESIYSRLSDRLSMSWNIGNGFKATGSLSFNKYSDESNLFLPPGHTAFSAYTPDDFFKRGKYNQTFSEFLSLEGTVNLHYNKKVGLHQFYSSAGLMVMETRSESTGFEMTGFTSDKLADVAFGNSYSTKRPESGMIVTRLASAYGNVTYSFDNRYQVEITGNADESSQFGKNNLVAPHWSAGASWNLHQERFFHENAILSTLRLRGSIGTAGNLFYQSYLSHTNYDYYTDRQYIQGGSGVGTRGIGLGAYVTSYANPDLEAPETQKQNIGLDAGLFQNKLFLTVNAYRNKTTGIVLPITSPTSTGFLNFNYYDNLGAIENKGVEFGLNYRIINNKRKGIVWSAMVNGNHNEDRVLSTSNYVDSLNTSGVDETRPQPRYRAGESLTGIWAVRSMGIDPATGKEKFLKADGTETFTWNASDKILAGNLSPKWQGSIGTSLTIKNISAGIYCNYQYGASAYNQTLADYVENADINNNVDARATQNRWTQTGDMALYKALSVNGLVTSPTYVTTRFVEKNDFINCASLSLAYSLPESIISKISAKNATLGFVANNAFQSSTLKAQRGTYYPFQRMYTFSITTSF
jgi:TonB-linked SusC/RagA family outer membrane protein